MALHVPDIGDFKDVAVIEILVAVGDTVTQEQSLITVESDKASMEIPSSHAGVLKALSVKIGDVVNIGDLIGAITVAGVAPAAPAGAATCRRPSGCRHARACRCRCGSAAGGIVGERGRAQPDGRAVG